VNAKPSNPTIFDLTQKVGSNLREQYVQRDHKRGLCPGPVVAPVMSVAAPKVC